MLPRLSSHTASLDFPYLVRAEEKREAGRQRVEEGGASQEKGKVMEKQHSTLGSFVTVIYEVE